MIDLGRELTAWLQTAEVRAAFEVIVRDAVRAELRALLDDELVGVEEAAKLLQMTPGALRKAVERGQVACQRVGRRVRFRRSALLSRSR